MNIYTIGFTKKNAKTFFDLIRDSKVERLIDVRLNNISQLAGFAKKDDLKFFLKELCNAEYLHAPSLAPTKFLLDSYKNGSITWQNYEDEFFDLMSARRIEREFTSRELNNSCLLCSEHEPHFCHRRIVVDYLNKTTNLNMSVTHLY
ncbi:MAG: DUF488 domain-containing protein [Paraglaciecola sp.]|nr:DUF488 domain-containing protein [Paraglaciecola sp.]